MPRPRSAPAAEEKAPSPARRLADRVAHALDVLRQGLNEAGCPQRELTDDEVRLELIRDDLAVSVSDLELVGRELSELGR